jgi:hypothetical protein
VNHRTAIFTLASALTGRRNTKEVQQAGPHELCAAPNVSARLGTPRVAGVPHARFDRTHDPGVPVLPNCPGSDCDKHRTHHQRGIRRRTLGARLVHSCGRLSGRLAPRSLNVNGRRLSAPPRGTDLPTAWLFTELVMDGFAVNQRETIWQGFEEHIAAHVSDAPGRR